MKKNKGLYLAVLLLTLTSCYSSNSRVDEGKLVENNRYQTTESENKNNHIKKDKESQKDDFLSFLNKFNSDSTFQKKSVKFPLITIATADFDGYGEEQKIMIKESEYSHVILDAPESNITDEKVQMEILTKQPNNTEVIIKGTETGFYITYYFKKEKNKWLLFKVVDDSV